MRYNPARQGVSFSFTTERPTIYVEMTQNGQPVTVVKLVILSENVEVSVFLTSASMI